ncbi:flagellin N-terminal helical domain-containing protein [Alkaliphilus sp. B6464]|uniref:flagellin N-terminal helical domain-containing protein n=1 Tax=Alkaliphilus sp. B6464 TaxID=2731219 RepID=UPI001BAAD1FF|nr:flagellin [Alkaliphilus sp. B6464]QUH18987.1 flagellin [Alkaliphilus sp. B6464]
MRINNNIPALNSHRMLNRSSNASAKVLERLSSGKRINRAADDAAGMAISEKMKAQVNGLKIASRNALDGISLIQTAEGAMNEVHAMLQRMRELAVQTSNGVYKDDDIESVNNEIQELLEEIDNIAKTTQFNGKNICNTTDEIQLQIGANENEVMKFNLVDITTGNLKIDVLKTEVPDPDNPTGPLIPGDNVIKDNESASKAITIIDKAIQTVSEGRSKLGATQNRLEHTIANVDNAAENLTAALSRIEDTDMALEMSEFTKYNILVQAGTAMLAQANQRPQTILQLLGN